MTFAKQLSIGHLVSLLLTAGIATVAFVALHVTSRGEARVSRDLELYADSVTGSVVGDHERIVEVLSNLVGNALKFTPPGGQVVLRAEQSDEAVRFVVADTGPGVAPDQVPHLFDRFWQGNRPAYNGRISANDGMTGDAANL